MSSNKNSTAPSGINCPQYPSQSADFISFDDSKQNRNKNQNQTQTLEQFSNSQFKRFQRNESGDYGGGGGEDGNERWSPVPHFYRNPVPNQHFEGDGGSSQRNNRGRDSNRYFGSYGNYRRGGYNQTGFNQRAQYNNRRNGGGYGDQRHGNTSNQRFENVAALGAFFHPSMLEDPWEELLIRRNKLRKHAINLGNPYEKSDMNKQEDNLDTETI